MDIKLPPVSGQSAGAGVSNNPEPSNQLQQLPRGTQLTAVVQSSTPLATQAAVQTGKTLFDTLLSVNGHKIHTQSQQAFSAGQRLNIEVTGNAAIKVLAIVNTAAGQQLNTALLQIQNGLRQALPIQQSPALLLNNLAPLFKLLNVTTSQPAKAQIRELLASIPNLKQLADPRVLKQSLNQSGTFLESNIKQVQSQLQQQLQHPKPAKSQTALRDNSQLNKQLEKLLSQDFKAQLLKLSGALMPLLSKTGASASTPALPAEAALIQRILQVLPDTTGAALTGSSKTNLSLNNLPIESQLQTLLNPTSSGGQSQQSAPAAGQQAHASMDLAVSTVLRQIAASLAQVQANQLQSLSGPRADIDTTLINSWNIEIPVFLEGQFKPIQLHINEERHPQASPQENSKNRLWKITLSFDFEELGEFFATLRIVDNSVSATFWSEKPETLQRISNELQHLNKSLHKLGLNVEELECRRGKPSLQETRLDQQLVDIKT